MTNILIGFPVDWNEKSGRALAQARPWPLSSYRVREPLVLDLVTLLLQPGHTRILVDSAATALVCSVLQAEEDVTPPRPNKARLSNMREPHRRP